jgi:hypothetical protein
MVRDWAAIVKAEFHPVVSTELQIAYRLGSGVEQVQEGMEGLGRRVVGTGRADDVKPVQIQRLLHRAQGINLAGNSDHRDAAVASLPCRLQKGEGGGKAHAHAPAGGKGGGVGDDDGQRFPPIRRVGHDGQHAVDCVGLQQARGDAGGYAGPLRTGGSGNKPRPVHRQIGAEE